MNNAAVTPAGGPGAAAGPAGAAPITTPPFADRWKATIVECLDEHDLKEIFRTRLNEHLWVQIQLAQAGQKVLDAIYAWGEKTGRLYQLTAAAAGYYVDVLHGQKTGLVELARLLMPVAAPDGRAAVAIQVPQGLPLELDGLIRNYDTIPRQYAEDQRPKQMKEKADALRAMTLTTHDLPNRFHLSPSPGARLAAIVSLEQQTDPVYLRWLAERVCVEVGVASQAAALALVYAALRLDQTARGALRPILRDARALITRLKSGAELNVLLDDAAKALDYRDGTERKRWGVDYDEIDSVLKTVFAFDKSSLQKFLRFELDTQLKSFANPEHRFEYLVFRTIKTANDVPWDRELMQKLKDSSPKDAKLVAVCDGYLSARANADAEVALV